jgi:hypothetical protein
MNSTVVFPAATVWWFTYCAEQIVIPTNMRSMLKEETRKIRRRPKRSALRAPVTPDIQLQMDRLRFMPSWDGLSVTPTVVRTFNMSWLIQRGEHFGISPG